MGGGHIEGKDAGVAYLLLTCCQKTTARDLDTELWRLNTLGMKGMIIDRRGNPGGPSGVSVRSATLTLGGIRYGERRAG